MDAECAQNSDQVLDAHPAIGCLDPPDYATRKIGALGQLSLGQPAQLPPRSDASSEAPLGAKNRGRSPSRVTFMIHI